MTQPHMSQQHNTVHDAWKPLLEGTIMRDTINNFQLMIPAF